jgi:hypothetical protein
MNFNFSFAKSPAFWSSVVLILSAVFTSLEAQYPTALWLGTIVSVLSFISVNYFHKAETLGAAKSSASLGTPVSGQN